MNILGIIPARGGSKGISQKNIRKIGNKPLIQYSIDAAKKSKITKLVVSTDDKKIAKKASQLGAEVPFLRPKKLAKDNSKTIDVINHTVKYLKENQNYSSDIVLILQPTSPLRTTDLINNSLNLLQRTKCSSVIAVSKIKTHPFSSFTFDGKYLKPFRKDFTKYDRRQQYPTLYFPTGAIFTFWTGTLRKYKNIYGPKIRPIITEQDISIDIDSKFDFFIAEMAVLHWKKYSKKFL